MSSSFWSNTIWYILLLLTSLISLILAIRKSRHRRFIIAFTAATLGVVFYIESVLVIVFNAYSYYPKIVNDPFQDTVFGNLFSQFSISSTAAVAIVYRLSSVWAVVFSFVYYLIDIMFVKLGIYEHTWYKSVYTFLGFIPLFIFIKFWNRKLIEATKPFLHNITLYLCTAAVMSVFFTMPLKVFQIQIFTVPFFEDVSKSHTLANLIYSFVMTSILVVVFKWKANWLYKGLCMIAVFLFQYFLFKSGMIYVIPGWFAVISLADLVGRYYLIAMFDRFLADKPAEYRLTQHNE